MSPKNQEITFRYIFPDDYNPSYITGAYGGISATGKIIASFFFERHPITRKVTLSLEDGSEIKQPDDLDKSLIRFVQSGVIMDISTAEEIVRWLNEKIQEVKELTGSQV
jgi:hypothetical protein